MKKIIRQFSFGALIYLLISIVMMASFYEMSSSENDYIIGLDLIIFTISSSCLIIFIIKIFKEITDMFFLAYDQIIDLKNEMKQLREDVKHFTGSRKS